MSEEEQKQPETPIDVAAAIEKVEAASKPMVSLQNYFAKKTRKERKEEKRKAKETANDNNVMGVFEEIKEAMHRGTEPMRLRYSMDADGFLTVQGYNTYRVCVDPENRPVIVHFEDPEDATFGQYNGQRASVLAPQLNAKSPLNKFLTQPDKATVTEARSRRTYEHWIDSTMQGCENNRAGYNISSGYLYKLGKGFWANDWCKYWAAPAYEDKEKKIRKHNDQGHALYDLFMYTSGPKTMDALELGETSFKKTANDILARRFSSKAVRQLTAAELKQEVRKDFAMREEIYYEGEDPEKEGINPLFTPVETKYQRLKHKAAHFSQRTAQKFNSFVKSLELQKMKKLGLMGILSTAGKLVVKYRSRAYLVGAITSKVGMFFLALGAVSYVTSRAKLMAAEKLGHKRHHDDVSHEFWRTQSNGLESKHHYGPLDPHKGHKLRVLTAKEAGAHPQHNFEFQEPECPVEMGEHAVADTTCSQRGAVIDAYQMGNCTLLKVTEKNGFTVFYAPYDETEYAILQGDTPLEGSRPVLSTVKAAFEDGASPERPIMKVKKDEQGRIYKEYISTEELLSNMVEEFSDCNETKIWTAKVDNQDLLSDPPVVELTKMQKIKGFFGKMASKKREQEAYEQYKIREGLVDPCPIENSRHLNYRDPYVMFSMHR